MQKTILHIKVITSFHYLTIKKICVLTFFFISIQVFFIQSNSNENKVVKSNFIKVFYNTTNSYHPPNIIICGLKDNQYFRSNANTIFKYEAI